MKSIACFILLVWMCSLQAGEVYDKGTTDRVPDWAIGPLLVVPIGNINKVTKEDCVRLGTLQSKSLELFGRRFKLAEIGLAEIPNDSHSCTITTEKEAGGHFEVFLSQSLADQTRYNVIITWIPSDGSKPVQQPQFTVWDVKSRKTKGTK